MAFVWSAPRGGRRASPWPFFDRFVRSVHIAVFEYTGSLLFSAKRQKCHGNVKRTFIFTEKAL